MEKGKIAKWLFVYFFIVTTLTGFFLILLGKSILHIDDISGIISIIIPTFIGQLTILVKWIVDESINHLNEEVVLKISPLFVKGPPIVFLTLMLVTFFIRAIGYNTDAEWTPDDEQVKGVITFIISIFNATTIYLISVYFSSKK